MTPTELEEAAKKALVAARQPEAFEKWLERLRMVARSGTATNIEPWDIGAFLLAFNEWAKMKKPIDCEEAITDLIHWTTINAKNAVRP